ncbi:MAG: S9 family peptidase [Prolixibacteraceae bacterium]|nr:S9 family peptidase [Prolixibacteraceae bacterium]
MKTRLLIFSFLFCLNVTAQQPAKKVLSINDFAGWETVTNGEISTNGKIISFEQNPQKGDGMLILHRGNNFDSIPRGYSAVLGSENNFVAFRIKQPQDTIRKAKLKKVKKDKMPIDSLGIFVFKHDSIAKFPKVKSFKTSKENATWVSFLTQSAASLKESSKEAKAKKISKTIKQPGDDLVLFRVSNADTLVFKNVTAYTWAKNGAALYFVRQTKDSANTYSSLHIFNVGDGSQTQLFSATGWLKKAATNELGNEYAFIFSADTIKEKVYSLYFGNAETEPEKIVDEYTQGIPVGWSPGENATIYFSKDGSKLYFGTAKTPEPEVKDSLPDEEKPVLDVWNWKDLKLQPQQKIEAEKEKKRTYLAVYHVEQKRVIQLADLEISEVIINQKGDGKAGLGFNEKPYLRASGWTGKRSRDYYLVDLLSGIKREMVKEKSFVRLSPQGKYVIWWEPADSSYYARSTDINNLDIVSLTKIIPINFYNELNDRPQDPSPYGIAGWSEDDRFVYIYDRYDIWKIDPSGERVPVCMTKAFGRRNKTRLRYVKLNDEQDFIPSNEPLMLSAIDERTLSRGFFGARFNSVKDPSLLLMGKYLFTSVRKAKNADKIIWTKENVSTFPDLWCSNLKFEHADKISSANVQQKEFVWPTVELVEWNSFAGEKLRGLLYKPDNFNPDKKYPMIVYFYERSSETLTRYQRPSPSHSTINKAFYVSNGYLVFVPDITYKTGYPGQSAYNAIVSGTQSLIDRFSFIDKKKIGLQGQSWGGYQTAYLITQTEMYAAAMAGAPVSNMTSAYGGIRWGTGISRMFQYEHTQSRIGGSLWEKPLFYIENSPLFYAPKIKTPLLIMHNDKDSAVPWYQGIEFFVALRRLNKPVWMLSYNGEPHNLKTTSWANRIDLSKRMFQFFNHYLKGKQMPEWMEKGVPATEKGENLGY